MAEAHNGAVVASQIRPTRAAASRRDTRVLIGILLFVIGVAAITAVVVTAVQGLTTVALIIALFTAAFFSRVGC
ncbi:MAG TPA: hypothetical protein VF328_10150 [Mycobacterium sp.]|jgi:hypothetical protein